MNETNRSGATQTNWDYENDSIDVPSLRDVQKSIYQYYLSLVNYYNQKQDLTEQDEELSQVGEEIKEATQLVNESYSAKTLDELKNKQQS